MGKNYVLFSLISNRNVFPPISDVCTILSSIRSARDSAANRNRRCVHSTSLLQMILKYHLRSHYFKIMADLLLDINLFINRYPY